MHTPPKIPETPSQLNAFAAALCEAAASMAIARHCFSAPPSLLAIAGLANAFLDQLTPQQDTFSITTHAGIYMKAALGLKITDADCKYLDRYQVKPAPIIKESISLALKGWALFNLTSLGFNLATQSAWAALKGAGLITATYYAPSVATTLVAQFMQTLGPEYQFLKPWLTALARLPTQFIPRFSVNEAGELQIQWPELKEKSIHTPCGLADKIEIEDGSIILTFTDLTTRETKKLGIHPVSKTAIHLTSHHHDRVFREACAAHLEETGWTVTTALPVLDSPTSKPHADTGLATHTLPPFLAKLHAITTFPAAGATIAPASTAQPIFTSPHTASPDFFGEETPAVPYSFSILKSYDTDFKGTCLAMATLKILLSDSDFLDMSKKFSSPNTISSYIMSLLHFSSTTMRASSLISDLTHPLGSSSPEEERLSLALTYFKVMNYFQERKSNHIFSRDILNQLYHHYDSSNPISLILRDGKPRISGNTPAEFAFNLYLHSIRQFLLVDGSNNLEDLLANRSNLSPGIYRVNFNDDISSIGHSIAISISTERKILVFDPSNFVTSPLQDYLKEGFSAAIKELGLTKDRLKIFIFSASPGQEANLTFLKKLPPSHWRSLSYEQPIRALLALSELEDKKIFMHAFAALLSPTTHNTHLETFSYFAEKYPHLINLSLRNAEGALYITQLFENQAMHPETAKEEILRSLIRNTPAALLNKIVLPNGVTLVYFATRLNLYSFVDILIKSGLSIHNNNVIEKGQPIIDPVYMAVYERKLDILKLFCQQGIDWAQYLGISYNPLTLAVAREDKAAAELLANTPGAPINSRLLQERLKALKVTIARSATIATTFAPTLPLSPHTDEAKEYTSSL